jgi:hypothetical protein
MSEPSADRPVGGTPSEYGTPDPQTGPPTWQQPGQQPVSPPGQTAGPVRSGAPMSPQDERTWAVAAHLSAFAAAYVALGLLGPLVVMLVAGPRSAYVRRHAVDALNFNISILIYVAIGVVLAFVLIGIPMLIATGILYLVAVIRGALAASRGEEYRYPLTIRFVS